MIIGIDASRANRKFKSGTEWYSYYLIKELAKIDAKNNYILYTDKPLTADLTNLSELTDYKYDACINSRGLQNIASPYNNFKAKILNWPSSFFWTQIRLSWEMLIHAPDVLFIPAHTLPVIHPRKSIITIHDIGFERERNLYGEDSLGPQNLKTKKIINWLVKIFTYGKYRANTLDYLSWSTIFGLKHSAKVITVSNFSKDEIKEIYQAPDEKIKVIYHGYNDKIYKRIADRKKINQLLNKYGIKQPFIFYVGRLEKKKNIPNLVNAFAIMREKYKKIDHKLVLVGNASFGYDEINYVKDEFNLDEEVIITGWVLEEDMPYIYNGATAFIFPSHYEGFGLPLLQAMACGTPIAASKTASIPEVAKNCALYFNPDDKSDMAEAIARIITDDALKSDLIENGFKRIKNFSWGKCARETLVVLENL